MALTEANEWDFINSLSTTEQYQYLSLRVEDPSNTPELQKKYEDLQLSVTEQLLREAGKK